MMVISSTNYSTSEYLGQITSALNVEPLSAEAKATLANAALKAPVQLYVASENKVKVEAAKNAVLAWLSGRAVLQSIKGFNAASKINEQPVGMAEPMKGAQNRITHLKELANASKQPVIQVYVAMENGIMPEEVSEVKNSAVFQDKTTNKVWVDRCYVIVEIFHNSQIYHASAFSRGVTTPLEAVSLAQETQFNSTAGSFIEQIYGFNAKDWHGKMAGVGRQVLMEETICSCLGKLQ